MGGYGSSRWGNHKRANTVNEAYSFDLKGLPLADIFADDTPKYIEYTWEANGKQSGNMAVYFVPSKLGLVFNYSAVQSGNRQDIKQAVQLETMPLNFGGVRYWMLCPQCHNRVRSLHCPTHQKQFYCRACHNLSYLSCQDSRHLKGSMYHMFTLQDKLDELHKKLRRCRYGSKNYKRYHAKLDKLDRQANTIMTMLEQSSERFKAKNASYFDNVKHIVSII